MKRLYWVVLGLVALNCVFLGSMLNLGGQQNALADTGAESSGYLVTTAVIGQSLNGMLYIIDTNSKKILVYEVDEGSKQLTFVAARKIENDLKVTAMNTRQAKVRKKR